jgi:hypothetical protein
MNLVFTLCPFDNLFQGKERPVDPDEGFSLWTFSPRLRESTEMAFSEATLVIMKEKVQSFELGIPVERPGSKPQGQRGG